MAKPGALRTQRTLLALGLSGGAETLLPPHRYLHLPTWREHAANDTHRITPAPGPGPGPPARRGARCLPPHGGRPGGECGRVPASPEGYFSAPLLLLLLLLFLFFFPVCRGVTESCLYFAL